MYGGDAAGSKYSSADDVTPRNVERLGIAWQWAHGEKPLAEYGTVPFRFENQPLMVDEVLYVTTPYNNAAALDATTGKELWRFESGAVKLGGIPCTGFKHRAPALWRDTQDGNKLRVLLNTRNQLFSLDARTGTDEARQEGVQDVNTAYNDFWWDRAKTVVSSKRTSLVTDPEDGKIPALTPDAQRRQSIEVNHRPLRATGGFEGGLGPTAACGSGASRRDCRGSRAAPTTAISTSFSPPIAWSFTTRWFTRTASSRSTDVRTSLRRFGSGGAIREVVGKATRWSSTRRTSEGRRRVCTWSSGLLGSRRARFSTR